MYWSLCWLKLHRVLTRENEAVQPAFISGQQYQPSDQLSNIVLHAFSHMPQIHENIGQMLSSLLVYFFASIFTGTLFISMTIKGLILSQLTICRSNLFTTTYISVY